MAFAERIARIPRQAFLLSAVIGGLAACGGSAPSPAVESLESFVFVRDDAGILPEGQRRRTESELRDIAERTGVFGVLVTAGDDEAVDPPVVYRPIIAEVTALGGEALLTICTPDACGPAAGAYTAGLDGAMPSSEPARPGERRPNVNRVLRDWVDYVEAVAAAAGR